MKIRAKDLTECPSMKKKTDDEELKLAMIQEKLTILKMIVNYCNMYPNDADLGERIRSLTKEINN